jgi:hypothetical protein
MPRFPAALAAVIALTGAAVAGPPALKVSDNKRFLITQDGKPFFYLGDTAWELFHRLNRADAELYLKDRAAKGFTVVQAVVLAELNGLKDPNPYGHTPLTDNDPTRPNDKYFEHVDWVVDTANDLGLYVGMLPTWGDKWNKKWGVGPEIFTPEIARTYGEWLGKRYRDKGIIWILGGDRNPETDAHKAIIRAMAEGVRKGDNGRNLITYHPQGGATSSAWFHDDTWLDFNMQQTGHNTDLPVADRIAKDYARSPVKPVMDGEPLYEDHPIGFNAKERGYSNAADVRKAAYWGVFAGGHGYTYGNHSVWQMYDEGRQPINGPLKTWRVAIQAPGAGQVRHLRALMESRPFLTRVPDQSVLASDPSAGSKRLQATRDSEGSYAFVYSPGGRRFSVRMDKITGSTVKAWWYNPRTGEAMAAGEYPNTGVREYTPPDEGENIDWVLVLDDAGRKFTPPGRVK